MKFMYSPAYNHTIASINNTKKPSRQQSNTKNRSAFITLIYVKNKYYCLHLPAKFLE